MTITLNAKILQTHVPCTVGSYIVPHKDLVYPQQEVKFNEGATCVADFCEYLEEKVKVLYNFTKQNCNQPQMRTPAEERIFNQATECKYCSKSFATTAKVWHHCHVSGKLLAPICQRCNTRIRQPTAYLPVFFHNLKNYDMHALCIAGFAKRQGWELKPIAQTKEKYITLVARFKIDQQADGKPIFYEIRFIDSFQFLTASLDRLSSSLQRDHMQHTVQIRQRYHLDDDILFSKGVFPYSYLDSWAKLLDRQLTKH